MWMGVPYTTTRIASLLHARNGRTRRSKHSPIQIHMHTHDTQYEYIGSAPCSHVTINGKGSSAKIHTHILHKSHKHTSVHRFAFMRATMRSGKIECNSSSCRTLSISSLSASIATSCYTTLSSLDPRTYRGTQKRTYMHSYIQIKTVTQASTDKRTHQVLPRHARQLFDSVRDNNNNRNKGKQEESSPSASRRQTCSSRPVSALYVSLCVCEWM